MAEVNITMDNFESEVLNSDKPVLVDFFATWCGPCMALGPIVEEFAEEFGDKIKVCKLDIDDNIEIAQKYRVMSVPTLKIFENGEVKATSIGLINMAELKEFTGVE